MDTTIRLAIAGILSTHKAPVLATKMGVNVSTLYKWAEPSTENSPHGEIPLRRAVQMTLVAGDTQLMDAVALEAGGAFVPGHQLVGGKFESEKAALEVMRASSKLIEDYIEANKDGRITAREFKVLAQEAAKVHLAVAAIISIAKEKSGI